MILTHSQLEQLYEQARRDAPFETCGLIGGKDGRALKIYPIPNVADNKVKLYVMDSGEQFRAMSDIEERGWELTAIYHSHPVSPAIPSKTDREIAYWKEMETPFFPGSVYIIMTLMNPNAPEAHGYFLDGETVTETVLEIVDE
jgi:[CysO sulfur-carrier protein]-S-L-cysteine hydrolase